MNYDNGEWNYQHRYNHYPPPPPPPQQQQHYHYSSAYYANGSSPPPIQSLLVSFRDRILGLYFDSPRVVSGIVISLIAIGLVHYYCIVRKERCLSNLIVLDKTLNPGEDEEEEENENSNQRQRRPNHITSWRELLHDSLDYIWISFTSLFEAIIRLRHLLISTSSGIAAAAAAQNTRRNEKRRGLRRGVFLEGRYNIRQDSHSSLPELVEVSCPSPPSSPKWEETKEKEIEPAFLSLDDYPEGWLVYDQVFGVIPKDVLDKWRRNNFEDVEREEEKKESMMISQQSGSGCGTPPVRGPFS